MDFSLSDDQKMILKTAADFVKKELPLTRMRKMRQDEVGFSRETYKQMGELGWLGIALPESVGGFGGSFVDASLILEQLGRGLVSEPYAETAVVAAGALLHAAALGADAQAQQERWLAPLAVGDEVISLAWAERGSRFDPAWLDCRAEMSGNRWRLKGDKVWVLAGNAADRLLVTARTSGATADRDGVSLFVVDREQAGVELRPLRTMDGRHAAHLRLDCELEPDRLVGPEGGALPALERALDLGAAASCCEGVGAMRASLDMTVEYLKTREQFGVKIGVFQALQHRAVDMFIQAELARSATIRSSIEVDSDDVDLRQRTVSAAKVQLAVSSRYVSQQAIQLHGGIGVTDEHDIGLYFKRLHVLSTLYGDEEHHVARFAALPSFEAGIRAS